MEHLVALPGVAGQVSIVEPGFWKGLELRLNGQPVAKQGFSLKYDLPSINGGTITAEVNLGFLTGVITVKTESGSVTIGTPLPLPLQILALLPLGLLAVGGAIGGFAGAFGMSANLQIARSSATLPVRIVLMMVTTALSVLVWLVAVGLIQAALGSG